MKDNIYPNQVISQETKDLAEVIYKTAWGLPDNVDAKKHYEQQQVKKMVAEETKKIKLEAEEKIKKNDSIVITMLYKNMDLSIAEIAQKIERSEKYVQDILKENDLI